MRELKFKAWNRGTKRMFWFDLMWGNHIRGDGYIGMVEWGLPRDTEYNHRGNVTLVDPYDCEIMQFTGLEDNNGKEIYEGDILKVIFNGQLQYREVFWYEEVSAFFTKNIHFEDAFYGFGWLSRELYKYEVIGNIYEFPELLKSKTKQST